MIANDMQAIVDDDPVLLESFCEILNSSLVCVFAKCKHPEKERPVHLKCLVRIGIEKNRILGTLRCSPREYGLAKTEWLVENGHFAKNLLINRLQRSMPIIERKIIQRIRAGFPNRIIHKS